MEQRQALVYFDRYTGEFREETIYGDQLLRWIYETGSGGITLEALVKRRWFSALYGRWADSPRSAREVRSFVERFGLDPAEFAEPVESFRTFNEFFYRKLKASARPVLGEEDTVCFPADGRHLYLADLSAKQTIYAKGQQLDLAALLEDEALTSRFTGGSAVISRLCPVDYHRFHFPLGGTPSAPVPIRGSLYSVNPVALARRLRYLWENKRQRTLITSPTVGDCLSIEIGATNVGGIVNTFKPGRVAKKGDEKGYFRFGGSMVMVLFQPGTFMPSEDLAEQSATGVELYAKFGDAMGKLRTEAKKSGYPRG